jgi:hypothetical protein
VLLKSLAFRHYHCKTCKDARIHCKIGQYQNDLLEALLNTAIMMSNATVVGYIFLFILWIYFYSFLINGMCVLILLKIVQRQGFWL